MKISRWRDSSFDDKNTLVFLLNNNEQPYLFEHNVCLTFKQRRPNVMDVVKMLCAYTLLIITTLNHTFLKFWFEIRANGWSKCFFHIHFVVRCWRVVIRKVILHIYQTVSLKEKERKFFQKLLRRFLVNTRRSWDVL